jgi:hypothetical protein
MAESLSEGDFAKWITPREAIARISISITVELAPPAMIRRLRGGLIKAAAKSSTIERKGTATAPTSTVIIPAAHWQQFPGEASHTRKLIKTFWETGDIRFWIPDNYHINLHCSVLYFGVRFDPTGIDDWVMEFPANVDYTEKESIARPAKPMAREPSSSEVGEEHSTLTPIAESKLRRWHEFFIDINPHGTEAEALAHAKATFPKNRISREQVRDMRGPQKRGKKPGHPR